MEHQFFKDTDKDRPDLICDRNGKVVLALCKVCGLVEGSLTTDCPGNENHGYIDDVFLGKKDFVDGRWVDLVSPFSPAKFEHLFKNQSLK